MTDDLLPKIEGYIERTGISAKDFALGAGCNSSLVYSMRKGHTPGARTIARVLAFLDGNRIALHAARHRPDRIDDSKLTRVDSRACFNCGASGYAGCDCHRPIEILCGVAL